MRLLLIADGRSPIARRWLEMLLAGGIEVHLVSTFPCEQPAGVTSFKVMPVALARWAGASTGGPAGAAPSRGATRRLVGRFRNTLLGLRYVIGPLTVGRYGGELALFIQQVKPDLVHALRIPFEGLLAAYTPVTIPLIVSIWGNDLTLHAGGSPWMAAATSRCLRRADALMADAHRDLRLALEWGLRPEAPRLAVPGSGGLELDEVRRAMESSTGILDDLPQGAVLVVNPRGFRPGSVRNDTFFQAVPLVTQRLPQVVFACPGMAGQSEALGWIRRLGIGDSVQLLPLLPQKQLWSLFGRAEVMVTPSQHDGVPNSLIEAMACGSFPIAGDIESLREWITPGVNGLLVDPGDPQALAEAIIHALNDQSLHARAAELNARLVSGRADRARVREQVVGFYERLISKGGLTQGK